MPRDGQLGRVLQLADWGHSGQDLRRTRLLHHRKVHCARFCLFCGALRAPARRQPAPVVGQGPLSTRRIPRTRPRTAPLRGMRVTDLPRVLPQLLAGLEVVVVVPFPRVGVMLLPSAGAPRCSQRCAPRTRQRLRAAGSNRFSAMGGRLRGVGAAGHPSGSGSSSSIPPLLSLLVMNLREDPGVGRSRGSEEVLPDCGQASDGCAGLGRARQVTMPRCDSGRLGGRCSGTALSLRDLNACRV